MNIPFVCVYIFILSTASAFAWIDYPADGFASMTHYDLTRDYIASCGCTGASTHYPTAALSQMAYGSSNSYGPGCGKCFKLTLLNTFMSNPPFYPEGKDKKSIVVKITDLCPLSEAGWCSGTEKRVNSAGHRLNFDLAYPSQAIPSNFFPSDAGKYGYADFGVWNISYQAVSCKSSWSGGKDQSALGSKPDSGGCCPADPTGSEEDTCPSYSDKNGLPPDTTTSNSRSVTIPTAVVFILMMISLYAITWV